MVHPRNPTQLIQLIVHPERRVLRRGTPTKKNDSEGVAANFARASGGMTSRSYYTDSPQQVQHRSLSPPDIFKWLVRPAISRASPLSTRPPSSPSSSSSSVFTYRLYSFLSHSPDSADTLFLLFYSSRVASFSARS